MVILCWWNPFILYRNLDVVFTYNRILVCSIVADLVLRHTQLRNIMCTDLF